jgi:hypothetical protein
MKNWSYIALVSAGLFIVSGCGSYGPYYVGEKRDLSLDQAMAYAIGNDGHMWSLHSQSQRHNCSDSVGRAHTCIIEEEMFRMFSESHYISN